MVTIEWNLTSFRPQNFVFEKDYKTNKKYVLLTEIFLYIKHDYFWYFIEELGEKNCIIIHPIEKNIFITSQQMQSLYSLLDTKQLGNTSLSPHTKTELRISLSDLRDLNLCN